jgi:GNAT superfamily N-acetyltransferase
MTTVTHAEPADVGALAVIAEEMERFYGAPEVEPLEIRVTQIREALFHDPPAAHVLLARNKERLTGFASYSFLWPAIGLTRSLYLKELYVAEAARGQGVGKLLMRHLYEIAAKHGCSRVEWTTDRNNLDAQRFYAHLGAQVKQSKLFYRLER